MRIVYSGPKPDCTAIRNSIRKLSGCGAQVISSGKTWTVQVPTADYTEACALVWGEAQPHA